VFRDIADRPTLAFTVRISYLEVYNEQMMDLLGDVKASNLTVVEEKSGTGI
jgi:kinesin family member 6/9